MKNNTIKLLALVVGLILGSISAQAANMSYTLYADLTVNLPTTANLSNQTGRVWLGNFSNGSSLLSLADIQSGNNTILNSFRPLTSFSIVDGSLAGDTGNGLRGTVSVGGTSVTTGNFAGQNAYILALSSTSSVWSDALSAWQSEGSYNAILIRSSNDFALNTGDPTCDFSVESGNGQLLFGTQNLNSITTATVPEPSAGMLLLIGAAGLGALRLRRKTV